MAARTQFISQKYWATAAARIARIFPAFGIGGVANKFLRAEARSYLAKVGIIHIYIYLYICVCVC